MENSCPFKIADKSEIGRIISSKENKNSELIWVQPMDSLPVTFYQMNQFVIYNFEKIF